MTWRWFARPGLTLQVGHCLCAVLPPPLRCVTTAFAAETVPLPCVSTAFAAKALPMLCVRTVFAAKALPLPCVSASAVAETVPFTVFHRQAPTARRRSTSRPASRTTFSSSVSSRQLFSFVMMISVYLTHHGRVHMDAVQFPHQHTYTHGQTEATCSVFYRVPTVPIAWFRCLSIAATTRATSVSVCFRAFLSA